VRSFNFRFHTNVLIEPEMISTKVTKVLGTDGQQKMSKSLNNQIDLAYTPEETIQRVMTMVTDPQRIKRSDPGNPDVCNVFSMHKVFSTPEEVKRIDRECRKAEIGCVDCKKILAANINAHLAPLRARRIELAKDPQAIWDVLEDGAGRARAIAEKTMQEVRAAVGLP
jgi:tryptophanyl-tRNA synthetase